MDHPHTPAVYCAACSRLITVAADAKPGDLVTCPFCNTMNRLKELTVLTAEAVDAPEPADNAG